MSKSNRKRARTLITNVLADITSTRKIPPLNKEDFSESLENWALDLTDAKELLKKKSKKQKISEEYTQILSETSVNETTDMSSNIHKICFKALPSGVSSKAMQACLTVLADDLNLGPLEYFNYNKLNDGTFCFNIGGKCPIHLRVHDGSAYKWQIHQKPRSDYSHFKCWRGGYQQTAMTCLF